MNSRILLFDTSICSTNMGDAIIMDAVKRELQELFPGARFVNAYTHDKISSTTYTLVKKSNYVFVGGTNLLSSNMNRYNQWKINLIDAAQLRKIILLGVGWWQYQRRPNFYTKYLLKMVLDPNIWHSVRDSYSQKMLKSIGLHNIINTACPTMWRLTEDHCVRIPKEKSEDVLLTLTDYNKSHSNDRDMIELLLKNYRNVYYWPQGYTDEEYLDELGMSERVKTVKPSLGTLDELLEDSSISLDYVGTRLHAGLRAMQKKRRTVIIGIDNRAIEKAKDFKLVIVMRGESDKLKKLINQPFKTSLNIPGNDIERWKEQFDSSN
jgi:polysaccharide pyruvyl transferase WcaK-like protein